MPAHSTLCPSGRAGLLLLGLLFAARPAAAQGWLGLAQSNYGGTHAAYLNPSAIADARHRAYLNLGAANASFYNTYLHRRKDRDGDLVSNKYDKYPKEKGAWALRGGPAPSPAALPALTTPAAPAAPAEPAPTPPASPAPAAP